MATYRMIPNLIACTLLWTAASRLSVEALPTITC